MPPPPWIIRRLPAAWSPECWTARYMADRIRTTLYWTTHPHLPWLTADANRFLANNLQPNFRVLEFGSGRSTRYFAKHCASVTTVEHDPRWIRKLEHARLPNVTLLPADPHAYAAAADSLPDQAFDLILIDGLDRLACLERSLPRLAPGGTLLLDNANRFFPNTSRGPDSLRAYDPANPAHQHAQALQSTLAPYTQTWTTNGVTDTLIIQDKRGSAAG